MGATLSMLIYFIGLSAAAFVGKDSVAEWPLYFTGAFGCALAVALLGAVQGPWVDRTAELLCKQDSDLDRSEASARLLSRFTQISASLDIGCMFGFVVLHTWLKVPYPIVIAAYVVIALFAVILSMAARDPPPTAGEGEGRNCMEEVCITCRYYTDPRAALLMFAPIAVGIFSAWKAMDLGNILTSASSIGADNAPLVNLSQQLSKLLLAKAMELIAPHFGTKPIMWLGSISILGSGVLALTTRLAWDGWWVIIFYVMGGLNWATLSTALNAVVLDHFKGEQASVAFSAVNMQSFLVSPCSSSWESRTLSKLCWSLPLLCQSCPACIWLPVLSRDKRDWVRSTLKSKRLRAIGKTRHEVYVQALVYMP